MTRVDIAILVLAMAGTATLYMALWQPGGAGARYATVQVEDETVLRLDLRRDGMHTVDGPLGTTRIQVSEGRVRVTDSPGRRRICVRDGWLDRPGAATVCLPNRVVIAIPGTTETELDGETW